MLDSLFDAFDRTVTDGSLTRRRFARSLAGVTFAAGLSRITPVDVEAKKRKKGKKRNRRGRDDGGNQGGGSGGGGGAGDQCRGTICDGQCVDLSTDFNNCGACGAVCLDDSAVCAGGRCVNVIGSQGS